MRSPKRRQPAEASNTRPLMSLSDVACEGSHMRYFGGLVSCPPYNLPLFRVWRSILQQSGPNQEVTPLPHLLLRWLESTTLHGHRPTCPGHRIRLNMTPSSQRLLPLLNHHRHRTKKPETYVLRQSETRLRMDLAHGGQQFEHISTCMPLRKLRLTTTSRVARARRFYAWGPSLRGDADEYNLQTHASRKPTNSHLTSLSPFSRNTQNKQR